MSKSELTHDTFTIRRSYLSSVDELFAAFSKPEMKRAWYAESPSHETLHYDLEFETGGQEVLEVRMLPGTPIADARLKWSSRYSHIGENSRIVFYQTTELNEKCISSAVVTLEFFAKGDGCDLELTHQAVFFEGADGPELRKMGWEFLLAGVEAVLPKRP